MMVCLLCNVVTVLNHWHNFDSLVDSAAIVCAKWFICIARSLFAANRVTKTRCTLIKERHNCACINCVDEYKHFMRSYSGITSAVDHGSEGQ